jgi:hypothetical protein
MVRAVDLSDARGIAYLLGANGPPASQGLSLPETSHSPRGLPGPLAHLSRPYDRESEPMLWKWSRVTEHLASIVPLRRVDQGGGVSLYV